MVWSDPATLRAEDVFAEMKRLAAASPTWLIAYVAVLGGLAAMADYTQSSLSSALNIAQLVLAYQLTIHLMEAGGLLPNGRKRGFGSYFVLGFLSGLGLLVGFALLIVPGIVLLIRWSPAYGYLFAEDLGASQSLGHSWRVTKPHFGALLAAAATPAVAYLIAFILLLAPSYYPDFPLLPSEIAGNLLIFCASAGWTLFGLAAYSLLVSPGEGLGEVFA